MQIRDFTGQGTWWVRELELSPDFTLLWDTVCKRFAHLPAYFQADHQPVSYHQLNQQIQALQPKIAPGTNLGASLLRATDELPLVTPFPAARSY